MIFQYFRYFLNPTIQPLLLPDSKDKNKILSKILSKPIEFKRGQQQLIYKFITMSGNFILAKLGKKSSIKKSLPTDNDFEEKIKMNYQYCHILFDLSNDPITGQKIAFEYKPKIFRTPQVVLKSLEEQINNQLFSAGYAMSINPILDENEFWNIVQEYQGQIQRLTFFYAAPNLFNLDNALSEELKASREKYVTTNITIELENKDAQLLTPMNDPFLSQSAEYTSKGGGGFKIKIKGKKNQIKSGKNVKTSTFSDIRLIPNDPEIFTKFLNIFSDM